jgi:predicted permease
MELAYDVGINVIIIFILMAVGFVLQKFNFFTKEGIKQMTNFLLNVVTPCVLIEAYQKEFRTELAYQLLAAALFTVIILAISAVLCKLIFKKDPQNRYRIDSFSSIYSNCGFMALPFEVFADTGLRIKENSPFKYNMIATNANRNFGYLPTEPSFGGGPKVYEARLAVKNSIFGPKTANRVIKVSGKLLEKMSNK